MTRALVVGDGSIGQRHARVLGDLECAVGVVSRRGPYTDQRWPDLTTALPEMTPDYVVVATETADHHVALGQLSGLNFAGTVLVEKPIFAAANLAPDTAPADVYVAYNLRFHPLIEELHRRLADAEIVTAEIHVGQHLADWRPDRDYRDTYSAQAARGGGALRDLSHELDYALRLFGPWRRVAAIGGRTGVLDGDAEDAFTILMACTRCPGVSLHLNMIDRQPRRQIWVNTTERTIAVDLIAGTLTDGGDPVHVELDRDATYRSQHEALLAGDTSQMCDYRHGLAVVYLIEAIERAAAEKSWVTA